MRGNQVDDRFENFTKRKFRPCSLSNDVRIDHSRLFATYKIENWKCIFLKNRDFRKSWDPKNGLNCSNWALPTAWSDAARRWQAGDRSRHLFWAEKYNNNSEKHEKCDKWCVLQPASGSMRRRRLEGGWNRENKLRHCVLSCHACWNVCEHGPTTCSSLSGASWTFLAVSDRICSVFPLKNDIGWQVFPGFQGFGSHGQTANLFAIQRSLWEITSHSEALERQTVLYKALKPWESGLRPTEAALVLVLVVLSRFLRILGNGRTEKCLNQHAAKTRQTPEKVFQKQCRSGTFSSRL